MATHGPQVGKASGDGGLGGLAYQEKVCVPARPRRPAGVPVLGYLHWTLMDNFEWIFGYGHQLGLHEVDRTTFARTAKPSATVYASLVEKLSAP